MKVALIKIGNSVRIPIAASLLDNYRMKDSVELILKKDHNVIEPITPPREGWEEAFKPMYYKEDDQLLIEDVFNDENL